MNRRIRKELKNIRESVEIINENIRVSVEIIDILLVKIWPLGEGHWAEEEKPEEISEEAIEEARAATGSLVEKPEEDELIEEENVTWSTADELPEKEGIYFKQLKELSSLKDVVIIGQVSNTLDLKSYISKKDGTAGLIYRFVLSDPSDDITVICFDDMAKECKQYMVGTHLKITKAWKLQENKHGVIELHVGNFAKVEVVE